VLSHFLDAKIGRSRSNSPETLNVSSPVGEAVFLLPRAQAKEERGGVAYLKSLLKEDEGAEIERGKRVRHIIH